MIYLQYIIYLQYTTSLLEWAQGAIVPSFPLKDKLISAKGQYIFYDLVHLTIADNKISESGLQ